MINLVTGWVQSPSSNHGVEFCGQTAGNPAYSLVCHASGTGYSPKLSVTYAVPKDGSPPVVQWVHDDGDWTASTSELHATWSVEEPQSCVTAQQYAIGTSAGGTDVVGWTSVDRAATEVTKTGLSLSIGVTYYFSVKAKNPLDPWSSVVSSDGITVDTTPPSAPVVDDGAIYTTDKTQLHATWTAATDPQSGVVEYVVAVGTSPTVPPDEELTIPWTSTGTLTFYDVVGLNLSPSTYYFYVKAKNGAGLWSPPGVSDGIVVGTELDFFSGHVHYCQ